MDFKTSGLTAVMAFWAFHGLAQIDPPTTPPAGELQEIEEPHPAGNWIRQAQRNGKFGFLKGADQTLVSFSYDALSAIYSDFMAAKKAGKYGAIDKQEHILIPFEYDGLSIHWQQPGVAVAQKAGKYGLLDRNGAEIAPFEYDYLAIENPQPGIIYALKAGKYGCLNPAGEVVVPFVYNGLFPFSDTTIRTSCTGMRFGLISTGGALLMDCRYVRLQRPDAGGAYIEALTDSGACLVDYRGRVVFPTGYDHIIPLPLGFFCVERGIYKGVADANNRLIVPLAYRSIGAASFITCTVTTDDTRWVSSANRVVNTPYWIVMKHETLRWGVLDTTGREILPQRFDAIEPAGDDGPFLVREQGKWGLFNSRGEALTPLKYSALIVFSEERTLVQATVHTASGDKTGLLDREGREIIPTEFEHIQLLTSGYFVTRKDKLFGLHNPAGTSITKHRFRAINAVPRAQIAMWKAQGRIGQVQEIVAAGIPADGDATVYLDAAGKEVDIN